MTVTYPLTGYEWVLDPDRDDGGIRVNRINADMPEYTPLKNLTLEMLFYPDEQDLPSAGGTLGGQQGFTLGGTNGVSLSGSPSDPSGHKNRYLAAREYAKYAGRYTTNESINGSPAISEYTPDSADIDSIIVKLEPGDELDETPGLWVVIDDADDPTRFIEDQASIEFSVTVLATGDEYQTRTELKSDLGTDLT